MRLDATARRNLRAHLYDRREAIATRWHHALLATGCIPRDPALTRRHLGDLADRVIALLLAEPLDREGARALGAALVDLRYREPTALSGTLEALGHILAAGLPAEQCAALQPRLAALLGELAAGFAVQARDALLAEQEQVRVALLSAHEQAQAARRAAEERLRTVVSNAPLILFACDRVGVLTMVEGRGLAALGYRPDDLVGRSVWEGMAAIPRLSTDLRRALAGEAFTAQTPARGRVFETHYAPLRDRDGAVTGVIGVALDITARVQAEATARCFVAGLTPRERALLPLLTQEPPLSYAEIGARLHIGQATVKTHVQHIGRKLGVTGRDAIATLARTQGLLPPERGSSR